MQNSSRGYTLNPGFPHKVQLTMTSYSKTTKTHKEKSTLNGSQQIQQTEEFQIIKGRDYNRNAAYNKFKEKIHKVESIMYL